MPRDRKAVTARKKKERYGDMTAEYSEAMRTKGLDPYNAYGYHDPTPHQAVKEIIRREIREKHRLHTLPKGM